MSKMGRPKAEKPKLKSLGFRMTKEESDKLQKRAAEHNLTMTQAVLLGIDLLYAKWDKEDTESHS